MASPVGEALSKWYHEHGETEKAAKQDASNRAAQEAHEGSAARAAAGPLSELELQFEHLRDSFDSAKIEGKIAEWKEALKEFVQSEEVRNDAKVSKLCKRLMKEKAVL